MPDRSYTAAAELMPADGRSSEIRYVSATEHGSGGYSYALYTANREISRSKGDLKADSLSDALRLAIIAAGFNIKDIGLKIINPEDLTTKGTDEHG